MLILMSLCEFTETAAGGVAKCENLFAKFEKKNVSFRQNETYTCSEYKDYGAVSVNTNEPLHPEQCCLRIFRFSFLGL